jgi:hypothetical protein
MIDPAKVPGLDPGDVKDPEYILADVGRDGRVRLVPFLFDREDETWDEFCARAARVSNALNEHCPKADRFVLVKAIVNGASIGLFLFWLIGEFLWRLFR